MAIPKNDIFLLIAVCASMITGPLMGSGVNAVLPNIGEALQAGATSLSMVGALFSLGLAVFHMACGSMGDIWGHRRLFLTGTIVYGTSCALAAIMPNMLGLLAARFLQGLGSAMVSATGLVLLSSAAGPTNRPLYLGISGAAVYAGIACGPPVAGFLAGALGWRSIFWTSAIASVIVFNLMRIAVRQEWRPAPEQNFDLAGCLLYGVAVSALTFGSPFLGQNPPVGLSLFGVFAIAIVLFYRHENRAAFPVLNFGLLRQNRILALSSLAAFANFSSIFGVVFFFSFYLQIGWGLSVQEAGFVLALQAFVQALATPLASRLCHKWSSGIVSAVGAALCGLGLTAAFFLDPESRHWLLYLSQIFLGMGISLFSLGNTTLIMDSAGQKNTGQGAALIGAMRTGGQVTCMVLITVTINMLIGNQEITRETMPQFMTSMRYDLILFIFCNILAVTLALVRNSKIKPDGA